MTGTASRPRRPRWDAKITGQGVCQVGSRYQAQSLRTWHVSGIDGDDARVHGEDEPRRRSGVILCGITTGRLDRDSPCLAFSLPRQRKIEKKGEEDEKR